MKISFLTCWLWTFIFFLLNTNESSSYSIRSYSRFKSGVPVFSSIDGSTSSQIDLTRAVQSYLNQKIPSPFIIISDKDEMISLDQNVTFSTDLVKGQGVAEYSAMAEIWSEACSTELLEAVSSVNRVAMTSQNVISIQWNVSFIPDSLQSLVWFSRRIPRTKLLFFNVLDKEKVRSVFSWKAFRIFLERILYTGVILLPHAVILGTTELTFRELVPDVDRPNTQKKWILLSSKEKINLVRSIDAGLLKNRKLATDLLQFLDSRKPSTVSLSDWNDVLVDRVPTRTVPGMGQFDIDGLEAEQQKDLLNVSNTILGFTTVIVLLVGIAFSSVLFDKMQYETPTGGQRMQSIDDYL